MNSAVRVCLSCGGLFQPKQSQLRRAGWGRFCSRLCHANSRVGVTEPNRKKDETGNRYGRLTVVEFSHMDTTARWKCICDCGQTKIVNGATLRRGGTKSCGCLIGDFNRGLIGDKNVWRGGKINTNGYIHVSCPDHHRTTKQGYVLEHILVMEKMLGRELISGEIVHHCNRDKADNRPYNLRLFKTMSEHLNYHKRLIKEGFYKTEEVKQDTFQHSEAGAGVPCRVASAPFYPGGNHVEV
jgi:hypothetical protein